MEQMSDKELLMLAAKAYGFGDPQKGLVIWTESEYPKNSGQKGALWNYIGHMDTAQLWNPLADDGDALRLAVKLKFEIYYQVDTNGIESGVEVGSIYEPFRSNESEEHAMRRAIVRSAAEVGEGKLTQDDLMAMFPYRW